MTTHFEFADAWWFRGPLRLVTLAVMVFSLLSLYPALLDRANPDHYRAIWGIVVLSVFVFGAVAFITSINDSYVDIEDGVVTLRFESFFGTRFSVDQISSVTVINPKPRWRYRWGLATNWRDRISCSHGGQMVEIELSQPHEIKLWPRTMHISRFWLAPRDHVVFVAAIEEARASRRGRVSDDDVALAA